MHCGKKPVHYRYSIFTYYTLHSDSTTKWRTHYMWLCIDKWVILGHSRWRNAQVQNCSMSYQVFSAIVWRHIFCQMNFAESLSGRPAGGLAYEWCNASHDTVTSGIERFPNYAKLFVWVCTYVSNALELQYMCIHISILNFPENIHHAYKMCRSRLHNTTIEGVSLHGWPKDSSVAIEGRGSFPLVGFCYDQSKFIKHFVIIIPEILYNSAVQIMYLSRPQWVHTNSPILWKLYKAYLETGCWAWHWSALSARTVKSWLRK